MELQGRPGDNTTAGLHNVLPDIECIVENLTEALQKYQHASPQTIEGEWHFATQIKLALDKAQEYYAKLDDSSAYLAATVLQPAKGWKFVEGLWRTQSTWLADGEDALLDMWATYKQQPISEAMSPAKKPQRQLNMMEQYRPKGMSEARNNSPPSADEFQRYCEQAQETDSPLRRWREIGMTKYPHLAQMAFDVLSIPAMSDEPERIFSRMGIMITKRRNHLEQDIIQATQCLYSWDKAELWTSCTRVSLQKHLRHRHRHDIFILI
jgi:hypothetical protein